MCGIAGFIHHQLNEEEKKELTFKMLRSIVHRGPENSSVWTKDAVSLGHNRLKIIDLSDEANQPFEYEGIIIVFNGEVYNYLEIRKELLAKGYRFRTQSDTEVMCAAYKEWGQQCKIRIEKYWDVDFDTLKLSTLSFEEKEAEFYRLFKESVQLHSRSDVQNGMCLSGGLDSSAIASMYSTLLPESKIKSFSVYYEGETGVDERPFVREVVNKYPNIQPHYFSPSTQDIEEHFHT